MSKKDTNAKPSDVRSVFGSNLRQLLANGHTISHVCREIGIHRSQFNRFLTGDAFPKPDVLQRICDFFETDARLLLQPLSTFAAQKHFDIDVDKVTIGVHPEVKDYFPFSSGEKHTAIMPCGFYRYYRRSYIDRDLYQSAIVFVYMRDELKFFKGFMGRSLARELNLRVNSAADREFRGSVMGTDTGVLLYAAQRGSKSLTLNYLELRTIVDKTFLYGYSARTMSKIGNIPPITKIIFEKLPDDYGQIMRAARSTGLMAAKDMPSFYLDMLQLE